MSSPYESARSHNLYLGVSYSSNNLMSYSKALDGKCYNKKLKLHLKIILYKRLATGEDKVLLQNFFFFFCELRIRCYISYKLRHYISRNKTQYENKYFHYFMSYQDIKRDVTFHNRNKKHYSLLN